MENTQKQNLSAKEIFSFGFNASKKYFWYFALLFLISVVISGLGEIPFIGWLINIVASLYLSVCFLNALIKVSRGTEITFKDFFIWPESGFANVVTSLVVGLIMVGFMLVGWLPILPILMAIKNGTSIGIVAILSGFVLIALLLVFIHVMLRLMFAKYYSIENNTWPKESIKASWTGTKGYTGQLLGLWIVSIGITILGVLALVVGLFWAIPTIYVAQAFIYTKLFPRNEENMVKDENNNVVVQPLELEPVENTDTVKDAVSTETN